MQRRMSPPPYPPQHPAPFLYSVLVSAPAVLGFSPSYPKWLQHSSPTSMSSFSEGHAAPNHAAAARGQQWELQGASGRVLDLDAAISPLSDGSRASDAWSHSPDSSNDSRHGSSPEGDSAPASARPAKSGRTPSRYDWSKHMPAIKRLYIDEDKTLKEVLDIMHRDYNFVAT